MSKNKNGVTPTPTVVKVKGKERTVVLKERQKGSGIGGTKSIES